MSRVEPIEIAGVQVREYTGFDDVRGGGSQTFDAENLRYAIGCEFEAGSVSSLYNRRGALRGFHVQRGEGREKYVACVLGEVFDVVVDLRSSSSTFGRWAGLVLSAKNKKALYVPRGVGHAMLGLSEESMVNIVSTATSASAGETGIDPFDPEICVQWPDVGGFLRSPRDVDFASLDEYRRSAV